MNVLKLVASAALCLAVVLPITPALALRASQYSARGHGVFTTSSHTYGAGRVHMRHHRHHYRHR